MPRASQTRNTLLLVHKLDSLPSTDDQLPVVSSGPSLKLTSGHRHVPVKNDRAAVHISRHKFTRTHESQGSAHNFGICRIGFTKSKTTDYRYYRDSQFQSVTEKTTYYMYSSFLSRAITVMISNSGITNVSIKSVPYMSYDIGRKLTNCGLNDDLEGIQSLLSNKEISIHSESLFFVSKPVKIH